MASATANSGSRAMSSRPYSPTQNDDAPDADSRAAKSWRNQRKSLGSRAKACRALKLSITMIAGECSAIRAWRRSTNAGSPRSSSRLPRSS